MARPEALLSANNISLVDGQTVLLKDIDVSIEAGNIVTIIGPNGAGKTTLLNVLLGLRKPSSGTVTRHHTCAIGYMPQKLQLNPQLPLTVDRFLSLANRDAKKKLS